MITVTIDGKQVVLQGAVTILEAARRGGIVIPTLCDHELLEPYGGCRLCVVEIEKVPRLQTACTQYVTDGMVISTQSRSVIEARRAVLEFLLIHHPLDCPVCDKAGECQLQDAVMKYGSSIATFTEPKRKIPENLGDPLIVRNMERCISCARCVRMCSRIQGASAIAMVKRSGKTCAEPFSEERFDCEYCGNCVTVCPVGALLSKLHRHAYRPWMVDSEETTICPFCAVGCSLAAQVRDGRVVRVVPRAGQGVNRGILCNRGRFGYDAVSAAQRVTSPLLRKDGALKKATWDEALRFVAGRLKEVTLAFGGRSAGAIASGRCANEDAYTLQRFFRTVISSNNIDSSAGLSYGPARQILGRFVGTGMLSGPFERISASDVLFVAGGDPASINPVLGLQLRMASRWGAPLVAVGHMPGLRRFTSIPLVCPPPAETGVLAALAQHLRKKGRHASINHAVEEVLDTLPAITLDEAAHVAGIHTDRLSAAAEALAGSHDASVIIGPDLLRKAQGHADLALVGCIARLTDARTYLMAELPNERGLLDMGCRPDILPGGVPIAAESHRKAYEEITGSSLSDERGLSVMEMIEAAYAQRLKALYVMGEDLLALLPDRGYMQEALSRLDLLVVHDSFLTETALQADAVLPAPFWMEQEGSYTNLEGRMQAMRKAVSGPGKEGWRVMDELSAIFGREATHVSSRDVLAEITSVSPLHRRLTTEQIYAGCIWPHSEEPPQGDAGGEDTSFPFQITGFAFQGKGDSDRICAVPEFSLLGLRHGYDFSTVLKSVAPEPFARLGTALAARLSVADGDDLSLCGEGGTVQLRAVTDPDLPDNVVMLPLSSDRGGLTSLVKWKMNPVTKTPVWDAWITVTEVKTAEEKHG
jgi:NADH-quinone oxidoreductase chain G